MLKRLLAEISRIIVITPYEHQPIVGFRQLFTTTIIYIFVIAKFFEAKAAISCYNDKGIGHAVLNTALKHKWHYIAMNITTHHDTLCMRELYETITLCHPFFLIQKSGVYFDNTHIAFRAERIALLIPCYFSIDDIHIAIFIYYISFKS